MLSTTIVIVIVIILYTMSTIASLYYSLIFCHALDFLKVITFAPIPENSSSGE